MNSHTNQKLFPILLVLCFLSLFLFLGQSQFNTRGEPREALVAYAMIDKGNWILPITNGTDMAYKPPMFHWCIAAISSLTGKVTEYTSRMPSAIALTLMIALGFSFYAKRRGKELAFLAGLITLTNFEIHRAGVNCRVDMLLSALIVMALYQLYKWGEQRLHGIPWLAILLMSGAALTKGPVGIVLPCLVTAVFLWIRGTKFSRIFFSFLGIGAASCVLPLLWYLAAWQQGGDQFLQLVTEENVLRFLGKMTYASHENPAYYNIITVLAGYAPYTLLVVISLFTLTYRKPQGSPREWWVNLKKYINEMDDVRLFSLLSITLIFIFYCIPKSKRSVYLLPIYPFIAYFLAEYILYLIKRKPLSVRIYGYIICALSIMLPVVFAVVKCRLVPHGLFHGRHAAENIAFLEALENVPLHPVTLLIAALPLFAAIAYIRLWRKGGNRMAVIYGIIGMTFCIYLSLDGIYQPAVLNVKSNKPVAERIREFAPEGTVYSYITQTAQGNRMHPFSINFYLGNRVIPFEDFTPDTGYLILGEREYDGFIEKHGEHYEIKEVYDSHHKSCDDRDMIHLYHFKKK
jgi:hypothetical protein BACCOPRO_02232